MNRILFIAAAVIAELSVVAFAGTNHNKGAGINGEYVVNLEAIAGNTCSASTARIVIETKGLMLVPPTSTVQQGASIQVIRTDRDAK